MNNIEFKKRVKEIHGDFYILDKVDYKNNRTKVCIICPKHGEFWVRPDSFLSGTKCKLCSIEKTKNNLNDFIERAIKVHGHKYDYSKVEYVNAKTKVCIICPVHGEFWQTPDKHLHGCGCSKCAKKCHYSTHEWVEEAYKVHGHKYDYSKVEYVNNRTKVCIICPKHGEFWQTPANHLEGRGCKKCANEKLSLERRSNKTEFISKAKKVHKDDYIYDKVKYINNVTPVEIICPKHGSFFQKPTYHLDGCGCPLCSESSLEREVRNFLHDNCIEFIHHANCKNIPWIGLQHLDFFLPKYNAAIECQGRQHFVGDDYFGGENGFKLCLERDLRKHKLCIKNNIKIFYLTSHNCIKYKNINNIYENNLYDRIDEILEKLKLVELNY